MSANDVADLSCRPAATHVGRVIGIEPPVADPTAQVPRCRVAIAAVSACGHCARRSGGTPGSGGGCGIRLVAQQPVYLVCDNTAGAVAGDPVQVDPGEAPGGWLGWVALAYGLPATLLIAGALLGDTSGLALSHVLSDAPGDLTVSMLVEQSASSRTGWRDLLAATGALAGLIGGLITGRYASRVLISNLGEPDAARIVAILPAAPVLD